jgi:hypothetical protein
MERKETNCLTGESSVVTLTAEEEAVALAQTAAWEAENTIDSRASKNVDAKDRLWFEVNFEQENRIRALEGRSAVTKAQYRNALINAWKSFNS